MWRAVESPKINIAAFTVLQMRMVRSLPVRGVSEKTVFPRSAIKAFQALTVLESGAADQFGFSDEEIALYCSSHGGEKKHSETARYMLEKLELTEET